MYGCGDSYHQKAKRSNPNSGIPKCQFTHWIDQSSKKVPLKKLTRPYRIIPPGSAVTMDHIPDRVNIYVNSRGIITKVSCG
jgi:hypothetical protein